MICPNKLLYSDYLVHPSKFWKDTCPQAWKQLALSFDYNQLPAPDRAFVHQATERIKVRMRRTAEDIIEIGRGLIEVKSWLKHGQFLDWLNAETEKYFAQDTGLNILSQRRWLEKANSIWCYVISA